MADSRFFDRATSFTLEALASIAQAELRGNPKQRVEDVAPLHLANTSHISFLDNRKYVQAMQESKAGTIILRAEHAEHAPKNAALLVTDAPYHAYARVAQAFYPLTTTASETCIAPSAQLHASASIGAGCRIDDCVSIGPNAIIGDGCVIEPHAVIGRGVTLGKHCYIGAGAVITHALIGNRVYIYRNACIGQDGFGFAMSREGHLKIPQLGRVIIEDGVEVGAGSCIDRGAGPDTVIGEGTFIDNLVQIGHNVQIGKRCVIVSQVGISGSCVLEDDVVLGGQAGIKGHTRIGKGSTVLAKAGIMRDVPAGETYAGFPAVPAREWHRNHLVIRKLLQTQPGKQSKEE